MKMERDDRVLLNINLVNLNNVNGRNKSSISTRYLRVTQHQQRNNKRE